MNDPIVEEVRRVRDAHAARFNYDLDAIFQDIKRREMASGLTFVDGIARQPAPGASEPASVVVQDFKPVEQALVPVSPR